MDFWDMLVPLWERCWTEEDIIVSITIIQGKVIVMSLPPEAYTGYKGDYNE